MRDKDCYLTWLTKLLKQAENTWKSTQEKGLCFCKTKELENFLSLLNGQLQGTSGRACAPQTPDGSQPVNGL